MIDEAGRLASLFEGRTDCYGDGGDRPHCVKQPVTYQTWQNHLKGIALGIYPRTDEDMVHWGCSDIDKGYDAPEAALNIQTALRSLGITSWMEITRSKGYHVWVFLDAGVWIPASTMRNALLLAHEIAEEPAREVNPKQVTGGIGNYVRVPYPGRGLQGKQVVFEPGSDRPLSLASFLEAAEALTNPVARIEEADDIYKRVAPPEPEPVAIDFGEYDGALEPLVDRLGPRARLRFERPLADRETGRVDRSHHLFCLVLDARDAGLTPTEALALAHDADRRWGKFLAQGRPQELERMVQRAYRIAP